MEQFNLHQQQADELERLLVINGGEGEHIRWIISDLRAGNIGAAKANYSNQSDKYDQYPEIKSYLIEIGIAEEIDWDAQRDEI